MAAVATNANASPSVAHGGVHPSPLKLTASQAGAHKVIVLLKDQPAVVSKNSSAWKTRQSHIRNSQAPLAKQLKATSKNVRSFQLINALAATVSTAEEAQLKDDPTVASVIPDEVIKLPAAATKAAAADATRTAPAGTCSTTDKPLLEPQALQVTSTSSDNPAAKTARSLGYTGSGVKVAYMAEGIDINNPDFIRADGSHVFSDYQDFSGDGTAAPTAAGEAFLDASAIAAQGLHTYDIQNFSAVPLDKPCPIRIEGMAPGASLVGLKVFAENNATTTSAFVQAIDYATNVDKVDVLNESFGGNPFPDIATADAVRLFNQAAVRAGVTVVTSSGDAGPTNTIGSPATDPFVISVGASTTYRAYAQTGYGGYDPLANGGGWLDDNISPLSSSGFTQAGRTINLIAPGDIDFAICTPDPTLYTECSNFAGQPSPVEESGGTSESAPLTAGAAALVIEAYRHTHGGKNPTPGQVKLLLTSTATDLNHPADEQGAGRLNSYQAVLAALSIKDANGSPKRTGTTVLANKTQIDVATNPNTKVASTLTLTNNGSASQKLALSQRTLGAVIDTVNGSVTLAESNPHFTDYAGQQTNYVTKTFTIPTGRARLDVDYVYPGDPSAGLNARVRLALVDPKGNFAAHSLPQGVGNAGHVDVRNPVGGTWKVMIWSRSSAAGGTVGKVTYKATTHNFRATGTVTPASFTLAAGASKTVTVQSWTPTTPGDRANSVVIKASGRTTTVPVATRSLVNLKTGGKYSGTLTGGNGREFQAGQTGWYQFNVAKGQKDLTANFTLSGKATDPVYGYLVDPAGNAQGYATNASVTDFDADGNPVTTPLSTLSLFARAPAAGRWTLILDFAPVVSGTVLSRPYSGTIVLNKVSAKVTGLPNSSKTVLKAGKAVTVPVTIKNTGVAPEAFFIDPRLNKSSAIKLAQLAPTPLDLPLKPTSYSAQWNVPTETTKVAIKVTAGVPVNFDYGWLFGFGDPDIEGTSAGKTATGTYSGKPVPSGSWFANPAEIGPFGPAGAPTSSADATLTATTLAFDPAVTTPIGNFEASSVDPNAPFGIATVQPGKSLTIPVTIKPSGTKGTVVSGKLFVDDITFLSILGVLPAGQELSALPYSYKIG